MSKPGVLIIDDDYSYRDFLEEGLADAGYRVTVADDGDEALQVLNEKKVHVVLLAKNNCSSDAIQVLQRLIKEFSFIKVIIISRRSDMKSAFHALRLGAFEFLSKSPNIEEFIPFIDSAAGKARKEIDKNPSRAVVAAPDFASPIIGSTPQIKEILKFIGKVSPTDASVLILGETGTGKELVSHSIHRNSSRMDGPFVVVNCSAIPDNLLESEIFGHEKGAFTDAVSRRKGLLEEADGGTIFLDEIADISPALQVKLLRAVELKKFRRLGSNREIQVNARIISATNKNLYKEVQKGKFRADFYYRLAIATINMPPLRDRKNDIPVLAGHFLKSLTDKMNKIKSTGAKKLSLRTMEFLKEYEWPGNIRELKNVIERLIIFSEDDIINPGELVRVMPDLRTGEEIVNEIKKDGLPSLEDMEKEHIVNALRMTDGHTGRASEVLGISSRSLAARMKKYNIGGKKVKRLLDKERVSG